jgi:hypothetical protein
MICLGKNLFIDRLRPTWASSGYIAQAKEWFCEEGKKSELRAAFADNA